MESFIIHATIICVFVCARASNEQMNHVGLQITQGGHQITIMHKKTHHTITVTTDLIIDPRMTSSVATVNTT